jgi:hypothetical protein
VASDQTPQKYKNLISANALGTGVFLQVGASGETFVTFEQNLDYEVCAQRGHNFAAFKWIPLSVSDYAAVVSSRCRLAGEPCSISCDADGCLCNKSRQECVDASGNSPMPPNTNSSSSNNQNDDSSVLEKSLSYSKW